MSDDQFKLSSSLSSFSLSFDYNFLFLTSKINLRPICNPAAAMMQAMHILRIVI